MLFKRTNINASCSSISSYILQVLTEGRQQIRRKRCYGCVSADRSSSDGFIHIKCSINLEAIEDPAACIAQKNLPIVNRKVGGVSSQVQQGLWLLFSLLAALEIICPMIENSCTVSMSLVRSRRSYELGFLLKYTGFKP